MTVSVTLTVTPSAPQAGAVVSAVYSVMGADSGPSAVITGDVKVGGIDYPFSETVPGPAQAVTYAIPVCPGLAFTATSTPGVYTATVPASGAGGTVTVTGSATVGGATLNATASLTLPGGPPQPSGKVPYPGALATGHTLLNEYLPQDLYAWRYQPGTTTPVVNGSGVSENPNSPRNVSVETDGGLSVLKLATKSAADCGVIQSPGKYPTASGVIETLIKFSGFTNASGHYFADWGSFWMYGDGWPTQGEIDAAETSYGNSQVSYHYGTTDTVATTDPWTYATKKVQLQPKNSTLAPAAPNILPDQWCHVTLAFGKDSGNHKVDVYYEGVLYCTIDGSYVTGDPMYITAGTAFGGPVLGSNQAPYDEPGSIEVQYVRVFS